MHAHKRASMHARMHARTHRANRIDRLCHGSHVCTDMHNHVHRPVYRHALGMCHTHWWKDRLETVLTNTGRLYPCAGHAVGNADGCGVSWPTSKNTGRPRANLNTIGYQGRHSDYLSDRLRISRLVYLLNYHSPLTVSREPRLTCFY